MSHPRIIQLLFVVKERKKLHLVMENGGKNSLSGVMRKSSNRLEEGACCKYFREILEGVAHMHEKMVSHRDLKPENILIDEHGHAKIIDFGFSAPSNLPLSSFCGTPTFMSPELIKKVPYMGEKADIWALGVMLYLLLVGKYPFRGSS